MTETYMHTETEIRSIQPIDRGQWIAVYADTDADGVISEDVAAWGEVWECVSERSRNSGMVFEPGEWELRGFQALTLDTELAMLDLPHECDNFLGVWPADTDLEAHEGVTEAHKFYRERRPR